MRILIRISSQCQYDENIRYCEDQDVWVHLIKNGNVVQEIVLPPTRLGRPRLTAAQKSLFAALNLTPPTPSDLAQPVL